MTTQNINRAWHSEHPMSSIADKDSTIQTLYNVSNMLVLIQESGALRSDSVQGVGGELLLKECMNAVAFEAWRLDNPENKQQEATS